MAMLADLIAEQAPAVRRALGGRSYEMLSDGPENCRLVADELTVRFDWAWRERWIVSSIQPHHVSSHPLDLSIYAETATDMWLRAEGREWPTRRSGPMSAAQLAEELALIEQVLAATFSSPAAVREALLFIAGYSLGYTDRVIVPEQAPPTSFVERLLARFRP